MNASKKILLIVKSLLLLGGISTVCAFALLLMFGINFWGTFALTVLIQFIFPPIIERWTFSKKIQDAVNEYNSKPYKKYNIPLTCQYCGVQENVDIDLEDTRYKCANCERTNAIYVAFTTAIISDIEQ